MRYSMHKGVSSRNNWVRRAAIIGVVFVILLAVGAFLVQRAYDNNLKPVGPSQHRVLVTVPSGSTAHQISLNLKNQGLIRADWAFEWYIRNHNLRDKLQAGTYYFSPNQDVPTIANILTQGKVATDLVTILPGQRIDQVRKALINAGFDTADVDSALNPANYAGHPALVDLPAGASLEGYLYPDSFQRTATTRAKAIVKASLDEMAQHLTPELRAAIEQQGLTVHQGIILASIVEQEVSNPKDKPTVAQVFLSRLRQNMVLGSDVTVIYGAVINGQSPSLTYDSAYNTHIHAGLPAGPISNVGEASLQAVAHPATTDYLFFVAGDDGVTYFSHTLEEHQQLTQEHCKKLCSGS